jgi:phosphohistidine phosphatase
MMMHELLLLRHGKAERPGQTEDHRRPLTDKGKRDARRVGIWLAEQDLVPDRVISSPAERALLTAEKTCKAMGLYAGLVVRDKRLYGADLNGLLAVLRKNADDARRIMLVGHNPGLKKLLKWLLVDVRPARIKGRRLPTAAIARLSVPLDWSEISRGCAQLRSLTRPNRLPKKFPFPEQRGRERRNRPAYYYKQSSVIPYRMKNDDLEILVILSSQKKHYVVPKGIWDAGLSAQDSAAKEAREEAGVEGRVLEPALGHYQYEKWGGLCEVDVYAMEVTAVVAEQDWEESYRGREWLSPEEAASRLKQKALVPMVFALRDRLCMEQAFG